MGVFCLVIDLTSVVNTINYEVSHNLLDVYQHINRATLPSSHRKDTRTHLEIAKLILTWFRINLYFLDCIFLQTYFDRKTACKLSGGTGGRREKVVMILKFSESP